MGACPRAESMRVHFGEEQAARLLWRAGFGPAPGQAAQLAKLGLRGAVRSLTRPASTRLVGPAPSVDGAPLAPRDAWGHDHLWWLDRMVRTQAPLVERMTLVWHDWFATSKASVPQGLMLRQNALLRRHALGNFERSRSASRATPRCCCGSTAPPTTAGRRTRTTRASCRSCSASARAAATP